MAPQTRKRRLKPVRSSNAIIDMYIRTLLELLMLVKTYHWKTMSYAQHKATDELYGKLNDNIDRFIEVLIGKMQGTRPSEAPRDLHISSLNETDFKKKIHTYRGFLKDEVDRQFKTDTDLLNIRDEILSNLNQFLYLMTFH